MKEPIKPSTLPPPLTKDQRLCKALAELDALGCFYEVTYGDILFIKKKANSRTWND